MNYYLTAIEGMPGLLDCCPEPLNIFTKKGYPDAFKRLYQQNFPTFEAIEHGYTSVIDKEQFITNMAEALVSRAVEIVEGCGSKRKKESKMMDLNMTMAVVVFPMILEYKGVSSQPLVDKLMEGWKREFPKTNIQAADYATIEKGFHKKFCYITTAVCESFGKPDDCYELRLLREYRDTYLAALPDGEEMIHEYYDVAPSIVKHINSHDDSCGIYRSIWERYLYPCITMIEQGELSKCKDVYQDMVYTLRDEYFHR